jgi:hypothetical protein
MMICNGYCWIIIISAVDRGAQRGELEIRFISCISTYGLFDEKQNGLLADA